MLFDFAFEGDPDNTTVADFKAELVKKVGNMVLVENRTIEVLVPPDDPIDPPDDPNLTVGQKFAVATGSITGFFTILLGYFKFFDPINGLLLFGFVRQLYHAYWRKDTLTTVTNNSDATIELIICEDTQDFTNTRTSSLSFKMLNKMLPNDVGVSLSFGTEETYTTGRRLQQFSIPKGQQKVFYVRTDYHIALAVHTGKDKYEGRYSPLYPGETRGYMIYDQYFRRKVGGDFDIAAEMPKQEESDYVPIARWDDWKEKFRGDDESVQSRRDVSTRALEELQNEEDEEGLDPHFFKIKNNAAFSDDIRWYYKFVDVFYRGFVFWRAGYCNAITNNSDKELELIVRENKTEVTTFGKSSFSYGFPEFIFGAAGTAVEFGHQQTFTTGRKVQWMHLMPGQTKIISIRADYEIAIATHKKPFEGETFHTEEGFYVHEIKQLPWTEKRHAIGPEATSGKIYFVKLGQWREFVRTMTKSSTPENESWMPEDRSVIKRHFSLPPSPPTKTDVLPPVPRLFSLQALPTQTTMRFLSLSEDISEDERKEEGCEAMGERQ